MEGAIRIFLYGTLKRGFSHHHLIGENGLFLGEAETGPLYRMYDCGGYPGLCRSDDGLSVRGEAWEIEQSRVEILDAYEGVAEGAYIREPVRLRAPFSEDTFITYFYRWPVGQLTEIGAEWPDRNGFPTGYFP